MSEKTDITTYARGLTGYDEIAIRRAFGEPLEQLGGPMVARAMQFVWNRRAGDPDAPAYKACMEMTLGELDSLWSDDAGKADGPNRTTG